MKIKTAAYSMIVPLAALVLAAASVAAAAAACTKPGGRPQTITLFTWAEMFPREILDGFTTETGIAVQYVNFDLNETMLTRLETSSGYDLVIADDYIIETVIEKGLAAVIDKSLLGNYGNINGACQKQFYDPQDMYTVPYGAGVQTIVYDPARLAIPIAAYADLWNPALRNKLGIIDSYRVINGMALKVLGKSYNTESLQDIRAAGTKLLELAPNIRLIRDDGLENELLSGEIDAAVMYTANVTAALRENPALRLVFPAEGIGFGIMAFFIPASAKNSAGAHAFIDYVLDARRGAECFEYMGYYSTYSASDPLISGENKKFLTLPDSFTANMEMIQNIGAEAVEEHNRIWTAFKEASFR